MKCKAVRQAGINLNSDAVKAALCEVVDGGISVLPVASGQSLVE